MYENIELFIIGIVSFIITFMLYIWFAIKYYKRKLKHIKDMAPSVTEMIIKSLDEIKCQQNEIFKRLNQLEVSVGQIKVKMFIYASLVGAITSGVFTYVFKQILQ